MTTARNGSRLFKRGVIAVVVLAAVGWGGWWGWREWGIRQDAKLAISQRIGVTVVRRICRELNGGDEGSKDGWRLFEQAAAALEQAENQVAAEQGALKEPNGSVAYPDYDEVERVSSTDGGDAARSTGMLHEKVARRSLARMKELGGFALLDQFAGAPRAIPPIEIGLDEPAINLLHPWAAQVTKLARAAAARMRLAQESRDVAEIGRALRNELALERLCERTPTWVSRLVAASIESRAWRGVCHCLMDDHTPELLAEIHSSLELLPPATVPTAKVLEAERSITLDSLAWYFSDPKRVHAGLAGIGIDAPIKSPGTYFDNLSELQDYDRRIDAELTKTPGDRAADVEVAGKSYDVAHVLIGSTMRAIRRLDEVAVERCAAQTMIAIEQYRVDTKALPASLDSLVPKYLPAIPIDGFNGQPLRYVFKDRTTDPQGRDYWLYSFGADGVDDHGHSPDSSGWESSHVLSDKSLVGYDLVFNDRYR